MLCHRNAASLIGYSLSQASEEVLIEPTTIERLIDRQKKQLFELNNIDIVQLLRFVFSKPVQLHLRSGQSRTNLSELWPRIADELVNKHVQSMDQNKLSILAKALSDVDVQDAEVWGAISVRFLELQHEFNLSKFTFLTYSFAKVGLLDEKTFYDLSLKQLH